jgi:hypothetical protein
MGLVMMTSLAAPAIQLAQDGKAVAVIVLSENADPGERTAAKELADYLEKITGGTFPVYTEGQIPAGGKACVLVGGTQFAREHGIDAAALAPEHWIIRTVASHLVLAGGRPRGTLYAAYHFLEDVADVHWWNPFEESAPRKPALAAENLDRQGEPAFRYRDIYMLYCSDGGRFAARSRLNRQGDVPIDGAYGGEMGYGPPYHVHTFSAYIQPDKYFKDHPEWFPLINGARAREQLCLTQPELRRVFLEKLKQYIETSRETAKQQGRPAPRVFSVSQNDCTGMCQCDACQAIAKAEDSEAGPLLDFVNYLADGIRDPYPDVWVDTLAYMMTQKPPKTIRPRDNVIIRLCDTDSNFTKPITDAENTPFRECLLSWAGIAKNLRVWDYAVTYAPYYGLPLPTVHTYSPDYRFYAEHHVEGVLTEHEYPILADLRDFKIWMMMKLLEDPYQDYDALVRTFMNGFYGSAGESMQRYLNRLETVCVEKPSHLSMGASPRQYHYLDFPFVTEATALFDDAEKKVETNPALLRRVRHARLPMDRAILVLWPDLAAQWVASGHSAESVPLNRDAVGSRCKDTWYAQIDFRIPEDGRGAARAEADAELKPLLLRPAFVPLPEEFRGQPPGAIFDYTADVTRNWQDVVKRVPDPEADTGLTNRLELSGEDVKKYALPMPWGLYDVINKRSGGTAAIRAEDVSGPGYHWYKLGTFPIGPSYYAYFFWSWIIQIDLENAVDPAQPDRKFDVWVRVKFEGPGFPHGKADQPNAICVERMILVKSAS